MRHRRTTLKPPRPRAEVTRYATIVKDSSYKIAVGRRGPLSCHRRKSIMERDAPRPHILVCDDDPSLRQIFEELLADEGYFVTAQATLCDEIDEIIQIAPDLIVLDLMFEGRLSGIDFLRQLKSSPATKVIPVLTCTAA